MSDGVSIKELLWNWVLYHEDPHGNARRIPFTLKGFDRWQKRQEDVERRKIEAYARWRK